jgi:hypothetical protein
MRILAYIDPGVGALIWQSIIGVFVGVLFYLRRTRKLFGRVMGKVFRIGQVPVNPTVDPSTSKINGKTDHLERPKQE